MKDNVLYVSKINKLFPLAISLIMSVVITVMILTMRGFILPPEAIYALPIIYLLAILLFTRLSSSRIEITKETVSLIERGDVVDEIKIKDIQIVSIDAERSKVSSPSRGVSTSQVLTMVDNQGEGLKINCTGHDMKKISEIIEYLNGEIEKRP